MFFKKINLFRLLKLFKYKILRLKDLPEPIAIGLAWGAAVSFTPLLGFHILICFLGTYFMKGNLLAAAAGTVVGNPWTFPIFFFLSYKIGVIFYDNEMINFEINISFWVQNFDKIFIPTLIGSIPLSILAWIITYKTTKYFLLKNHKYAKKKN